MSPTNGSGAVDASRPIVGEEAVRPLSVGLFAAVFIPTAILFGGGLLTSLYTTVGHTKELEYLRREADDLQEAMERLEISSKDDVAVDIAGIQRQLSEIHGWLASGAAPSRAKLSDGGD